MNLQIIEKICDTIIENKDFLTELDREIGDGDHGVNLARGMEKIKIELPNMKELKPFEIFNKMAMLLMGNVGGASGALYATALMKIAGVLKSVENIDNQILVKAWNELIIGIQTRGKATLGEKTMLDTLIPAYETFKSSIESGEELKSSFEKALVAGKNGMESVKDKPATKGRASYLGERSIGHLDPGSYSSYLILKTICENL